MTLVSHMYSFYFYTKLSNHTKSEVHLGKQKLALFYTHPTQNTKNRLPLSVITQNEIFSAYWAVLSFLRSVLLHQFPCSPPRNFGLAPFSLSQEFKRATAPPLKTAVPLVKNAFNIMMNIVSCFPTSTKVYRWHLSKQPFP